MNNDESPWPFDQPRHCAVFTVRQIMEKQADVLLVSHDAEDHGWHFLTRETIDMKDAMLVALSEIVALHPDVLPVADLPPGWNASRESTSAPWIRHRDESETG